MQSMQSSLQSSQVLTGTSLLGHSVLVSGNTANLASGGTVSGAISAPAGASSLTVQITNSSGNVVKTMTLTPDSSGGLTNFKWDGTNSTGSAAPPGQYTVNVAASVNGAGQLVTPLISSTVNSVTLDPSTKALELNTNNGTVALSSVAAVL
jgi:flagellar basal-body rod modification protein FlgD